MEIVPARDWVMYVAFGSLTLCVGSVLLLVGPVVWLSGAGDSWFALRGWAVLVHGAAWVLLAVSLLGVESDSVVLRPAMKAAFIASIAGFIVGWWGLPLAFPAYEGGLLCVYEYQFFQSLVCGGFFMYAPSVFAPVVLAHSVFFLLFVPILEGRTASATVVAGSFALVSIASLALGIQLGGGFRGTGYLLSGLTVVGYALVTAGFWAEVKGLPSKDWAPRQDSDGLLAPRD